MKHNAAYKPTQLYFLNLWRFAQPPQLNFKFMITNLNTRILVTATL